MNKAEIVVNYNQQKDISETLTQEILNKAEELLTTDSANFGHVYHLSLKDQSDLQEYIESFSLLKSNQDKFIKFEEVKESSDNEKKSNKEEFIKIFNALPGKAQIDFLNNHDNKAINIDGQFLVRVDEDGPLENHFVAVKNLKLNLKNSNKHYKYDNFDFIEIDKNDLKATPEVTKRDKKFDQLQKLANRTLNPLSRHNSSRKFSAVV